MSLGSLTSLAFLTFVKALFKILKAGIVQRMELLLGRDQLLTQSKERPDFWFPLRGKSGRCSPYEVY